MKEINGRRIKSQPPGRVEGKTGLSFLDCLN